MTTIESQIEIILIQISHLAIVAFIGAWAFKKGIITENLKAGIATLIIKITFPLLIFTSVAKISLESNMIQNALWATLLSYFSLGALVLGGVLFAKSLPHSSNAKAVHQVHMVFGNIVFIGFPLFIALYPTGEGIFYATIFQIASTSLLWTYGIMVIDRKEKRDLKSSLKTLLNGNTIAFFLGLIILFLRNHTSFRGLPTIFQDSLGGLGKTTIYLSMLYIGALLSTFPIKEVSKSYSSYLLSFLKLLVIPSVVLLCINTLDSISGVTIDPIAKTVVVMQSAMPCMAVVVVLTKKYGGDDVLAGKNLFISTVLSLISLPLLYFLCQQ